MKRTSCIAVGLLAAGLVVSYQGQAFQKPDHQHLPDFDKRLEAAPAAAADAKRAQATARLQARVTGVKVDLDPLLGSPKFVNSTVGFLSGPNGVGKAIGAASAARFDAQDPHRAVKAFLDEHAELFGHGAGVLTGAKVTRESVGSNNGLRTVVWQQELDGLPVFESVLIGNISRRGELVNLSSQFLPDPARSATAGTPDRARLQARPTVSADAALLQAAASIGDELAPGQLAAKGLTGGYRHFQAGQTAAYLRPVWLPLHRDAMRLAWEVLVTAQASKESFQVLVDADTGEVLIRRSRTFYISPATYNVYTSDSPSPFSPGWPTPITNQPPFASRSLVTIDALSTNASPNGWINDADNDTQGNNADVFVDWNFDQLADGPRPVGNPSRVFDYPMDLTQPPLVYSNAATVQFFYFINWYHDRLYDLGFTESAGNYQLDNFGRGGFANDRIIAYVQAGAGVGFADNAFFSPAPDGFNGQIAMFVWSGPTPDRDGDVDAEIIFHEATHGTSDRLVGGGVGITALQTGGMGEGWSDFYALALLSESADDPDGVYAAGGYVTYQAFGFQSLPNYYYGVRHFPYSTDMAKNPFTFKDIDPAQVDPHVGVPRSPIYPFNTAEADEVHHQGEVWCMTLWEVRANLVRKLGYAGNQLMLQLVTDGMKLCPPNPNFLQARDAIIQADIVNNNATNFFDIWNGFAKRGMGASAYAPASSTTAGIIESFDLPGLSVFGAIVNDAGRGNGNGAIDYDECFDLSLILTNQSLLTATNPAVSVSSTTPGVQVLLASVAYPDIPFSGLGTNLIALRLYTSPSFVCGTPIDLVVLTTSSQGLRTNLFTLSTGGPAAPVRFNNNSVVPIPDNDPAGASSYIAVTGINSALNDVTVSLFLPHTFTADLVLTLIAPDGTTVLLSDQNGGSGNNYGSGCSPDLLRTTFSDAGTNAIANGSPPFVGTFRPDSALSVLRGKSGAAINGLWQLHVVDTFVIDLGSIQCWSLTVTPSTCSPGNGPCPPSSFADLTVLQTATPNPFFYGFPVSLDVVVTNIGPAAATNVVLTNVLPANATLVSATLSQGTLTNTGTNLIATIGTVLDRGYVTLALVVTPTNAYPITNLVDVQSLATDPNPFNNSSTLIVTSTSGVGIGMNDLNVTEGNSGTTFVNFPVVLSASSTVTNTVQFAVVGGTATAGGDFVATNGTLTFPPGTTSRNISIGIVGDLFNETDETFAVNLFNPTGNGIIARPSATGTILNNDPIPTLSIASTNRVESNAGTNTVTLTVALSAPSGRLVSVGFSTAIDTLGAHPASVGTDYGAASGTLFFPLGTSNRTINIPVYGDSIYEDNETFLVNLGTALNATVASPQAVATVLNDDSAPSLSVSDVSVKEGAAGQTNQLVFTVSLDAPGGLPVTVDFTTQDNDALLSDSDYVLLSGSLSFSPGVTNRTVTVEVLGDDFTEGNESFFLSLSGPSNAVIGDAKGSGMILNDDGPILSIDDVTDYEGPASTSVTYTFTVSLQPSNASSPVVVSYMTADDTATEADGDFAAAVDTLTFLPGETNKTIQITVYGDVMPELTERFFVDLSGESGATIAKSRGVATVRDDDMLADLQVGGSVSPGPYYLNYPLTYSLFVTNNANTNYFGATNVVLTFTNTLGANVTFGSIIPSAGSVTATNGLLVWTVGNLTNGEAATLKVTTTPTVVGPNTAILEVVSDQPDPVGANNVLVFVNDVVEPTMELALGEVRLVAENGVPANGAIDAGEVVQISFVITNGGTLSTTNLTATLQTANGVVALTPALSYGALVGGGLAATNTFALLADAAEGATITTTLTLTDGSVVYTNLGVSFLVSSSAAGANSAPVGLPSRGPATNAYPSTIDIAGVVGLVDRVTVTLSNVTHAFTPDLDVLLVGPLGQTVLLMSDVGGASSVNGVTLTFADAASASLPQQGQVVAGEYKPTNFGASADLFTNGPVAPFGTTLAVLNGASPNGQWSLYVVDDANGDAGFIGGWSLSLHAVTPVTPAAGLSVTVTDAPNPVFVGSNYVYSITVSNAGPATATGILLTNVLPAEALLVSTDASPSGDGTPASPLVFDLGTLGAGGTATVNIEVTAIGAGQASNFTSVASSGTDLYPADNVVSTFTQVNRIAAFVSPPPSSVTNNQLVLTLQGQGGLTYVIEASTNLIQWLPIQTNTTFDGQITLTVTNVSGVPYRFFRAVER